MDIIALERHSAAELIACLRRVPLMEQTEVLIYEQALISLEQIHTDCLHPPQNYLWLKELRKIQELRWSLAERGEDLLHPGWVALQTTVYPGGELAEPRGHHSIVARQGGGKTQKEAGDSGRL